MQTENKVSIQTGFLVGDVVRVTGHADCTVGNKVGRVVGFEVSSHKHAYAEVEFFYRSSGAFGLFDTGSGLTFEVMISIEDLTLVSREDDPIARLGKFCRLDGACLAVGWLVSEPKDTPVNEVK